MTDRALEEKVMQKISPHSVRPSPGTQPPDAPAGRSEDGQDPGEPLDLAHELRTSLAIIMLIGGNLDLLYERLTDAERRKMIRDIRKHTQKLNELIADVLASHSTDRL